MLANYETRFTKIEHTLAAIHADLNTVQAEVQGDFNLLKCMIGLSLAMIAAILWKLFTA